MGKDDILFIRHILDKDKLCRGKNILASTGFLDTHQQSLVFKHKNEFFCPFVLWGGYEDAERKILFFLPDYLDEVPNDEIKVVKASFAKGIKLTHRDFLGSALGLGIKRENTGDILICDDFAQIFILPKLLIFFSPTIQVQADRPFPALLFQQKMLFFPMWKHSLKP